MDYLFLAILWILYFVGHSILASNQLKGYTKKVSSGFFPFYRIFFNVFAIGTLLPLLSFQRGIATNPIFEGDIITQIIGYGVAIVGVILGLIAFSNYSGAEFLGLDFNKQPEEKKNVLNTSGFNKYVRHPLYFATLLMVWGYFLANPTTPILIMNGVISIYLIIGTKLEEQKLIEEFGEGYKDYIKEVPMLLPKIKLKS